MSDFIVSARKYRPKTFDAVIGQSSVTQTLKNAIKSNQLAQSYLFCGPRGVGKTTCARIFAKEVNQFSNDTQLDDFSFNIFELDAASNNSVDDIRNLTDQVRVPPQTGKYKIYIIDEVHMLSTSAFNAFLKTLEEPPLHAKFILATTEKNKIIPTILSRCQIFDFKRVSVDDITNHLAFVVKSEGITAEQEALHLIAQKSDGAIRDSLSLLDRLISFSDKNLTYKSVIDHLNILDYTYYFKVTDALLKNDLSLVLNIFNEIIESGFDGHNFVNGLAEHLRDILVSKDESTVHLLEKGEEIQKKYLSQARSCDIKFLLSALNLLNECDIKYKNTNNQRLLVELSLMRISSINLENELKKKTKNSVVQKQSAENKILKNQNFEKNEQFQSSFFELNNVTNNDHPSIKLNLDVKRKSSIISINNPVETQKKPVKDEVSKSELRKNNFSESELFVTWQDLIFYVKNQGKSNLATALEIHKPILLEKFIISLPLSNAAQSEIVLEEKYMILDYLRNKLENDAIELITEVVRSVKNKVPYTNKDKFRKMLGQNQQLENLRVNLGLDPEY